MMAIYLLHSTVWIGGSGRNGAQHYLGYVEDAPGALERRLNLHRRGHSDVAIVRAFVEAGAKLYLGNFFPFLSREDERELKDGGNFHRLCQVCAALADAKAAVEPQPKDRRWTRGVPFWTKQRIEQSIKHANSGDTIW